MSNEVQPYISADKKLPEFTLQAVILGVFLGLIMCAATIYVGLYAGMTVSAAIPASVISMGVLRGLLKRGTILENNVVHTIASAGESLAAGIIFTVPALVLLGLWTDFSYWKCTLIAIAGGVMGVVMMIPLRRPMIVEQPELKFPEGVACAEVLKAGDRGGTDMLGIFWAVIVGGLFKGVVQILGLFKESVEWAVRVGPTGFYAGTEISPMLMAVGFIVGLDIAFLVFLGGAISFAVVLPIMAWGFDPGGGSVVDGLLEVFAQKVRFVGIGAMVVAGAYSIVRIAGSLKAALATAFRGLTGFEDTESLPRTDRNISGRWLVLAVLLCLTLTASVYYLMTGDKSVTAITTVAMFILAFFFVAVASYIVGLVGSSNSPVSGMTICTVLITAGLLLLLGYTGNEGIIATFGVAGVVCCAACTSGDICQDLKIGQIVGATPRALQMGELVGAVVPAFIIAPTLQLLNKAYGIVEPAREGVKALPAPQASMFKELVGGIFGAGKEIPWNLMVVGGLIGVAAILVDRLVLAPRNHRFRLHAMPLAVGMYLPWTVTFPILFGGIAFWLVEVRCRARGDSPTGVARAIHRGLLFSSGLVAGEALMGILIAVLMLAQIDLPLMKHWSQRGLDLDVLSLGALGAMTLVLIATALRRKD